MDAEPPTHEFSPQELEEFAAEELGPASVKKFREPEILAEYQQLRRDGIGIADAALRLAHREASHSPEIGDEFLGHFLSAMMRVGTLSMRAGLRRYLDSGDLVNSVMGSLWKDLASTSFTTRSEYLAYLGRRLNWKAADRDKGFKAAKRRQDRQVEGDIEELGIANHDQAGPATQAGSLEERERLFALLPRLSERDREVLMRAWRGEENSQIAAEMGLSPEAARKALERAIDRARGFLGED